MKENKELKINEKLEIKGDVKDALNKALDKNHLTDIDQIGDTLNQSEVDKMLKKDSKTKKEIDSKKPLIITIVLLVLITISGLFIYFSNNPKTIFKNAINKAFNTLEHKLSNDKIKNDIKITNNVNGEESQINIIYETDPKNEIYDLSIGENIELYSEKDKLYLENSSNQFIEIDNVKMPDNQQLKTILNEIKNSIIKGIDGEKFYGSNMQVEINGKLKKIYRSSLTIDEKNINNIVNKIEESLKNSDKFVNTIAEINNKSKDEIKKDIVNYMMSLKSQIKEAKEISINLYTNGPLSEFVKLEINQTISDKTNTFTLTKNEENKYTIISDDKVNNQTIKIDINKNKNKTLINSTIKNDTTVNYNTEITETKIKKVKTKEIKESIKFSSLTEEQKISLIMGTFLGLIPNGNITLS